MLTEDAAAYAEGVTLLFPGGPRVEPRMVTVLAPHEVFVVPTNAQGVHGRGAAGIAFRGSGDRHYRHDPVFLRAQAAPPGHPDRVGRWAIFGQAQGGMRGHEGRSYGIVTVTAPGAVGSVSAAALARACAQLCATAHRRPELTFLVPPLGCGLARGEWETFRAIWQAVARHSGPLPPGLVFVRPEGRTGGR